MSTSDQPPPADRTTGPAGARPAGATRTADRPCVDCLDPSVAVAKPAWRLSRPVAFWLIAYAFAVTMLGTTLPTPLYVIYQGQWHFSTSLITLIFASYAVAVLTALLLAGRSSDQVGRRPVLAAAICLSIVSAVTFILAPNVGWLFVGRVLSGLSAGLMTGTATAALTETARPGAGAPCVAGLVGCQPGRPRSRPAAGRAAGPVRARPDGASLRGPARAGGGGRARPAGRAGDGGGAFRAVPQVPRPRYPAGRAGPSSSRPGSLVSPRSPCLGCSARLSRRSSSACCTTPATRSRGRWSSWPSPSPPASSWAGPGCRPGR